MYRKDEKRASLIVKTFVVETRDRVAIEYYRSAAVMVMGSGDVKSPEYEGVV